MRTTVVYILRLLVDRAEPDTLRGILRDVASGDEHAFTSFQGLLELLRAAPAGRPAAPDARPGNEPRRKEP